MQTITVGEARNKLAEILTSLVPGEEVLLTREGKPAATIRSITPLSPQPHDAPRAVPERLAMRTMLIAQAQGDLAEIVSKLSPGEEIVLTADGKLIATVRSPQPTSREPPRLGTLKGTILYVAPDFDAIPEGFEEYLP